MNPMTKRLILLTVLIFFFQSVFSIHPTVRNYKKEVFNAGTQNWDIIQSNNDWMYFANNQGLLEFDGSNWTTYPILNYTNVRSLYYDKTDDKIYAGAYNEFGYYARNGRGILEYHSLSGKLSPSSHNFDEVWAIHKLNNEIYFRTNNDIFIYRNEKFRQHKLQNKITTSAIIQEMFIISMENEGLFFLNGDMFMKFPDADRIKGNVCAILPYENYKMLFVTEFNGLYIFDGKSIEPLFTKIDSFLAQNQIFCSAIRGAKLAIGTVRNGLVVLDLTDGSAIYSNLFSGLQNNTILSMYFDANSNLWLGLDKGIDYVQINSPIYELFGNQQLVGSGYVSLIKGNKLYLGTNQGLYVTNFPIVNSPSNIPLQLVENSQGQIWCLTMIDDVIFCGNNHGLYIIGGNTAHKIPGVSGTWNLKKLKKNPDYILGSSYQGFFVLKKSGNLWKFSNHIKGFDYSGGMFEEDSLGFIWFSHWQQGLFRLELNETCDSISYVHYDASYGILSNENNVLSYINNTISLSTYQGFLKVNENTGKIETNDFLNKLIGHRHNPLKFIESPDGDIWGSSFPFIFVAFKQGDGYMIDSVSFGPLKNKLIFGFENFNFINDSNIIVSTEDGFSWLDMTKRDTTKTKMQLAIRAVFLTSEKDSVFMAYTLQADSIIPQIKHKNNSIRFQFVGTEYRDEKAILYSCLLENYDSEWIPYTTSEIKEYTKLKKGIYTFRVRAVNKFSQSDIVETSYTFEILPAWYETNFAYSVYSLLIVGLLLFASVIVIRYYEKKVQKMKEQKEKEMKEQAQRYKQDAEEQEKEIIALRNEQLQHDLRMKSQELANSTMNLIRKNEILTEILNDLKSLEGGIKKSEDSKHLQSQITEMSKSIKENIETDNNWTRFEENFDIVYENYLKRLAKEFPNLTVNDKRLCAYLKMGLSSKDISPLLNLSVRSVEMARYRLRKKIELDRDDNLTDFLQRF